MNKEQAEQEAVKKNAEWTPKFCPLIWGKCNKDCVCFEEAYEVGVDGDYSTTDPECVNGMFFRSCEHIGYA